MAKASFLIISSLPHVKCVRVRAKFIEIEEGSAKDTNHKLARKTMLCSTYLFI